MGLAHQHEPFTRGGADGRADGHGGVGVKAGRECVARFAAAAVHPPPDGTEHVEQLGRGCRQHHGAAAHARRGPVASAAGVLLQPCHAGGRGLSGGADAEGVHTGLQGVHSGINGGNTGGRGGGGRGGGGRGERARHGRRRRQLRIGPVGLAPDRG
eukprot:scaffold14012_cov88-Isochrysis_galbana.AAC.1